jgi:hypothetical protein
MELFYKFHHTDSTVSSAGYTEIHVKWYSLKRNIIYGYTHWKAQTKTVTVSKFCKFDVHYKEIALYFVYSVNQLLFFFFYKAEEVCVMHSRT